MIKRISDQRINDVCDGLELSIDDFILVRKNKDAGFALNASRSAPHLAGFLDRHPH